MSEEEKYKLDIALPNGVILTLIGILILLTPMVAELTQKQVKIDYAAGGFMVIFGIISMVRGIIRKT